MVPCSSPVKFALSLNALVSSRGTIFRRVLTPGVENAPSTKGLGEVNAGGRYANFVGEFAVIEHRPVHRVFRAQGVVCRGGP